MLYETRKVLLGFRLKLTFDVILDRDMSCIFVDVSKTPTVGMLLNTIIERFKLPQNCFLTVQNCKLLNYESIFVLVDVNFVKVSNLLKSKNEMQKNHQSSDMVAEESISSYSGRNDECDIVDGKSKASKKPFMREGIAGTIKMLMEEEEMNAMRNVCSALSISDDTLKIKKTKRDQEYRNVTDKVAETSLHCEEISDLNSDACSDLNIEKRKRKRKRKHSKKDLQEDQPPPSFITCEPISESNRPTVTASKKHIHFNDVDGEETFNQSITTATDDVAGFGSRKSANIQVEQPASNMAPTSVKSKERQYQDTSYTRPKSSFSIYSGRIAKEKNSWDGKSQTNSANPVSAFIDLPRLSEAEKEFNKPKCDRVEKELATLLMCKELHTSMEYSVQFTNKNGSNSLQTSQIRSKKAEDSPINSLSAVSQSSIVVELNQPPKEDRRSTDLLRNLKFEGGDDFQPMEASSDDCEVLKQIKLVGNHVCLRRRDGTWTVLTEEMAATEFPKLETPTANESIVFRKLVELSRRVEMILNVKRYFSKHLMRIIKSIKISKIMKQKAPSNKVGEYRRRQSRIMYLNQNFCPTVSLLLYGRIVSYKPDANKLALEIPPEFIQTILNDTGEESFPETLVPITGSTFEVDFSNLIEPRVIS